MMTRRCAVLIFIILFGYSFDTVARDDTLFPQPAAIEHDVQFWIRVYTEVTTSEGFIHDDANLAVVYEKISIPERYKGRTRQRYINNIKDKYEKILNTLSRGKRSGLSTEEQRVLDLWPKGVSNKELRAAKNRIRFQLGQSNKFRAGLIRSGSWKPYINKTLDEMGLPREIAALPHVESSFNHKAYSKVGAAGMWQFMRSTGRRFMRVDHVLDERMDPFAATVAAARLLENNYAVTGAWPLAITAYNHGAAGMRRAAAKLGTTDITTILRKYRSRTFGFASRNFYVAFLAAVEIDSNPEKYFGKLELEPPVDYEIVKIPAYVDANALVKALNIPREELMDTNPALRPAVWSGNKYVPKGYELKINRRTVAHAASAHDMIAKLSANTMFAKQKPDRYHRVRRGQTISTIAARYGVKERDLVAVNNLRSRNRIYVGQVLRLPQGKGHQATPRIQVAEERSPKVAPPALPASGTYTVRRGDTVDRIARRNGMSPHELLAINNIRNKNKIYPGQKLTLVKSDMDSYTVRRGDSIERIAKEHGKDPAEILALNNIRNKNRIYPGQKLMLTKSSDQPEELELPKTDDPFRADSEGSVIVASKSDTNAITQVAQADNAMEENIIKTPADATSNEEAQSQIADDSIIVADDEEKATTPDTAETQNTETADDAEMIAKISPDVLGIATDQGAEAINSVTDDTSLESSSESIGDQAILESQTELLADPTDYSVGKNNTIEVQAAETLGHYAEWLQLRASDLRRVNRMRYGKPVVVGKRLKLKFTKVTPAEFEEQRIAYHRALQEEFFEQYQITGSDKHKIRRGQSVWKLSKRTYNIPLWLLRQYNPDLDIDRVKPGTIVTFPKLEERTDNNKTVQPEDSAKNIAASASNS
ncbi:LysM peptidoglycan-binding domain-containing protein [Kaarinaea lacus]